VVSLTCATGTWDNRREGTQNFKSEIGSRADCTTRNYLICDELSATFS
jgi:hypothetical protein